jgi:hypothetical protein
MLFPIPLQSTGLFVFRVRELAGLCVMDDIVRLEDNSQSPSNRLPFDTDFELPNELIDDEVPVSFVPGPSRGGIRAGGRSSTGRSTPVSSQTQAAASHKVRGSNWTEAEMLVLIGQKRIEWDGRHSCNQLSLAKFVY